LIIGEMQRLLTAFSFILMCIMAFQQKAFSDFGNFSSILIGDRAAGLAGAFTALSSDPSASSFYNPATLAGSQGSTLSASANVYMKNDTSYSSRGNLSDSAYRVNRGAFQPIPSSAGSIINFGTFATGLSVIIPDYDLFNGDITSDAFSNATTLLRLRDQSLWVGGSLGINFTDKFATGLTVYYTSRDFSRSITDTSTTAGQTKIISEEKNYTSNSIVYILGTWWRPDDHWRFGLSYRFPSLQLSGDGSYYKSTLDTSVSNQPVVESNKNVPAESRIPRKTAVGLAYEVKNSWAISLDYTNYGVENYIDMPATTGGESVQFNQISNYALGLEYYIRDWVALRTGIFTNYSSHPEVQNAGYRQPDHVDMLGYSANLAIFTDKVSFTFGGYYTGGRGQATEEIGGQIITLPKTRYLFNMLLASAYFF